MLGGVRSYVAFGAPSAKSHGQNPRSERKAKTAEQKLEKRVEDTRQPTHGLYQSGPRSCKKRAPPERHRGSLAADVNMESALCR